MSIEIHIISQQIKILKERPASELEEVYELVQRARLEQSAGLSTKEYKKKLKATEQRLFRTHKLKKNGK